MKEITKEKYRKGLICFGNESFKSPLYGEIGIGVKETVSSALKTGDIEKASKNYNKFKETKIIPFTNNAFIEAEKERSLDEPIDIIDDSINTTIENTLFMKSIQDEKKLDFDYQKENIKIDESEDKFDKSFILDFSKFTDSVSIDTSSNENLDDDKEKTTEEVIEKISEENEKPKQKVKSIFGKKDKKLKKTGYVDTVILCLVAQLTIFGILILVLLMIK